MVGSNWDMWNREVTWYAPHIWHRQTSQPHPLKPWLTLLRGTEVLTARTWNTALLSTLKLYWVLATPLATSRKSEVWIVVKFLPIPTFYNFSTVWINWTLMNNGKNESSYRRVCEAWMTCLPPQGLCTCCSLFLELPFPRSSSRWFRPQIKRDCLIKVFPLSTLP